MPGGLMNLVAYGNQNVILNGNPKKHFLQLHIQNTLILVCKSLE